MNTLTRDLMRLTAEKEREAEEKRKAGCGRFRQTFHLMPPTGWLNDPNGLCQFKGVYHVFFQYSPFDAQGGLKMWGHYTSRDMISWEYHGAALYPDQPFDCHGVYSGCAWIENEKMYLYYTGNVKMEDRDDYDYINSGRQSNTVLVESEDGFHLGRKKLLMKNEDYPDDLTLHVRDPKVWKENGIYYMLQGARTKADTGQALIFESKDLYNWKFKSRIEAKGPSGYMWECPDYYEVGGVKLFGASLQGLEGEEWKDRNVYQSGYFTVDGDILTEYSLGSYCLWDYGFDYYAPQSFVSEDGRRIQIGWMGMPDCEDYTNRTLEEGWQHCLTIPREIYTEGGVVRQRPVRELEEQEKKIISGVGELALEDHPVYDAVINGIEDNQFCAVLGEELILEYRDGRFEMRFTNQSKNSVSGGRRLRYTKMETVENVRILTDVSSVEVFVNDGAAVFTTRYYPENANIHVEAKGAQIEFREICVTSSPSC